MLNRAVLPDQEVGGCVHVRPPGDFFEPPGTLLLHFTGSCHLKSPYDKDPPGASTKMRRCRCFLSHFGSEAALALLRRYATSSLQNTACGTYARVVRLPLTEDAMNGSLPVVFTKHCTDRAASTQL